MTHKYFFTISAYPYAYNLAYVSSYRFQAKANGSGWISFRKLRMGIFHSAYSVMIGPLTDSCCHEHISGRAKRKRGSSRQSEDRT